MLCVQVSTEPGNQYNITLMNSLVLYVGTQAITYIHSKGSSSSTSTIAHTAHMDIFQHLVVDLDTEGERERGREGGNGWPLYLRQLLCALITG